MSFTRWLRALGTSRRFVSRSSRSRPTLEGLDDRLAPSAGPGWANFLAVAAHFGHPEPPKESAGVASQFSVFVARDATVGSEVRVTVVARDADGRPVKDYTGT